MIVFLTTHEYAYTIRSLVRREFDVDIPAVRSISYRKLFQLRRIPAATYVFADLDRLQPYEREFAADVHRGLGEAGLVRLNDPEKVLLRHDLLKALQRAGINPFDAYRADERPRPKRFPVILRLEDSHTSPAPPLLHTQEELDATLDAAAKRGEPLNRLIVIEYCAEPVAPGVWKRFGTFRCGNTICVTQAVTEDTWYVKHGKLQAATEELHRDSYDAVKTNRFADAIRPAFEISGIEYGRADHATVGGKQVIYEINTNPMIGVRERQPSPPIVSERNAIARRKMAEAFWQIDSGDGRLVSFPRSARLKSYRFRSRLARLFFWKR